MLYNGWKNILEDVDFVEIGDFITRSTEANFWKNHKKLHFSVSAEL